MQKDVLSMESILMELNALLTFLEVAEMRQLHLDQATAAVQVRKDIINQLKLIIVQR